MQYYQLTLKNHTPMYIFNGEEHSFQLHRGSVFLKRNGRGNHLLVPVKYVTGTQYKWSRLKDFTHPRSWHYLHVTQLTKEAMKLLQFGAT